MSPFALGAEDVENLVGIAWEWPIIESKDDLRITKRQGYRAVHSSELWVLPGINGKHTDRSNRVWITRTVLCLR